MRTAHGYILLPIIFVFCAVILLLIYTGYLWPNKLFSIKYTVQGLDVSHYQHTINWSTVPGKYSFVFIKATEGSDLSDDTFLYNWENARKNGFLVGAYHFYTTQSSGEDQAAFFIKNVPAVKGVLPPVIDLEVSSNKDKAYVLTNLSKMMDLLEKKYNVKPILYVTEESYRAFIKGNFSQYRIWIRNMKWKPSEPADHNWLFWQYSNKGRVAGIPANVDLNYFSGSKNQLQQLLQ